MSADRLNAWLSLFANVGVVVGLILIIIEIQQNTEMMRAQISHSRSETAQAEQQAVFNSEFIPDLLVKVRSSETLTPSEMVRYTTYFRAFNRNQDNVYWQYREGFLEENVPRSIRAAVRAVIGESELSRALWESSKEIYTDEYIAFVDESISTM